jgi:hypothetical protein
MIHPANSDIHPGQLIQLLIKCSTPTTIWPVNSTHAIHLLNSPVRAWLQIAHFPPHEWDPTHYRVIFEVVTIPEVITLATPPFQKTLGTRSFRVFPQFDSVACTLNKGQTSIQVTSCL